MDMKNFKPFTAADLQKEHSKTLYRSICMPSVVQSYSLCIEYMKNWFLSKFSKDMFKSIYVDGKNIYDDFRSLSKIELLKRQKPALTITPSIVWDFNNDHIDSYPYGISLYTQTGRFKESFFKCVETNSYMGIGMETLLMEFRFRIKVETRAQQLDLYKYIQMACRIGFSCSEDVDLDFHIPYELILQLAKDNGFTTHKHESKDIEVIDNIPKFLRWLNMYSSLPFLYKHRTLNGRNEFFLRMRNMPIHIKPGELTADDGEREGQMTNNFTIEFSAETRFPAPKMYAYYSDNAHELTKIYGVWYQPHGPISTCYTFKETIIPDTNKYGWPLLLSTTYESDEDISNEKISIDVSELITGDLGECIKDCISKGISPAICCELIFYNAGEYIPGDMNWETCTFTSSIPVRNNGTFIGVYVDNDFVADYILKENNGYENRLQSSKKEK